MTTMQLLKRLIDLSVCVALVPLAVPISLLAMAVIRLEGEGSPLFVQTRVGRRQKAFRLYKLRTMRAATGDLPSHMVGGAQITRVGAVLRRTKLDELPQLLNVLNGTMSLVGPRPCLPSQSELIAEREKRGIFAFAPGITGPAQIEGIDMSDPARLAQVEADYFPSASLASDLAIMTKTVFGAGRGDPAMGGP